MESYLAIYVCVYVIFKLKYLNIYYIIFPIDNYHLLDKDKTKIAIHK